LYRFESCSDFKERMFLRVFEDRGRGRIFEPEEHEVRKKWK
jgi:hypothetical protein